MNYYNDNDPYACAWLRELISAGLIPNGIVDERSIGSINPDDLAGFYQCHFFAGIGGWSRALELAGWDEPCWTGSCPCQPFSQAGKRKGTDDHRHLWPEFARLIRACNPSIIFGEQVASADGRKWLAGVFLDLEGMGYRRAGADLCAAGVSAPQQRQRLFWVASAKGQQPHGGGYPRGGRGQPPNGSTNHMASSSKGLEGWSEQSIQQEFPAFERGSYVSRVAGTQHDDGRFALPRKAQGGIVNGRLRKLEHPTRHGREQRGTESSGRSIACGCGSCNLASAHKFHDNRTGFGSSNDRGQLNRPPTLQGFWDNFELVHCRDEKFRRIEPGSQPLVARLPKGMVYGSDPSVPIDPQATAEARVMRLKGYGNSIVPQVAAEFVRAYLEVVGDTHK